MSWAGNCVWTGFLMGGKRFYPMHLDVFDSDDSGEDDWEPEEES